MRNSAYRYYLGFLPSLACGIALFGCEDDEKKKALANAERSRMSLVKAEAKLTRAQRQIADLQKELDAVKETCDTLDAQVMELLEDRDKAVAVAEKAQEGIRNLTARSTAQTEDVAMLQSQINELASIIESQEKTISEQEATIEELLKTIELQQQSIEEQQGSHKEHEDVNDPGLD
jgi:chromosome segregation ATPase